MSKRTSNEEKLSFEEALQRLEDVLQKLERSDCPLEEALALYQEGTGLVKFCRAKLTDAESKISILLKDSDEFVPFAVEGENR